MIQKINRIIYLFFTFLLYSFLLLFKQKKIAQSWLFNRLTHLGGIYVKFLQLLALNENSLTINTDSLEDILTVYDQVNYEDINITRLLQTELGLKAQTIKLNSLNPFAAGSFAQVYSGVLNNQSIVIKVLRPSVIKYLRFDLKLLDIMVHLISFPQVQNMLDFVTIFDDFKSLTLEEINYKHEVNNAVSIRKELANHPVIYIPKTYPDFCTSHIIVQEKIEGLALTKLFSDKISNKLEYVYLNLNTNLNYVMEELAVELLSGSLKNSGSHGDPHPGNIYILPNNRIALIDFGIGSTVQKYQPELLQLISQYVALYRGEFNPEKISQAMISYYVPCLTKSIQTVSSYYGKQDLVAKTLHEIGLSVTKTMQEQNGDPAVVSILEQYNLVKLFTQVINKNNHFGLKITFNAPSFSRGTLIFIKITRLLGLDIQLLRRSWERVLADSNQEPVQSVASYDNESIDSSFHTLAGWFDRLHYSDPGLYNRVMQNWEGTV